MERESAMGSLCAMTQRHGTPSIFLTVSLDDIHNPLTLRAAFPSKSNTEFPADPGTFLEALRRGDANYEEQSTSENSMHSLVSENPVASTMTFKLIMENLFNILIGIPLAYKVKKTTPI
jgi:hypothetical protein